MLFNSNTFVFSTSVEEFENEIYKIIILPVVVYGCETWSLILREKRRPRLFENRILRRIFRLHDDENGAWRRLHNEFVPFT